MNGVVFFETLRRTWKSALGWAAGVAIMVVYVVAAVPDVKTLNEYAKLLQNTPKAVLLMMVSADQLALATPRGMFGYLFFGWIMLILVVYGVIAGLSLTANEEESGIMDMLLAQPLPRWRVVLEKFAAYTVNMLVIALITFAAIWLTTANSAIFNLPARDIAAACFNLVPSMVLSMAVTGFIATVVRRRTTAIALSGIFVVVSYVLALIGVQTGGNLIDKFSFFTWYDGANVFVNGVKWGGVVLLLVAAGAFIAGATALFQRRDVGV